MRRLVLLAALLLVPTAGGGSYSPPPGDCCPTWSPDRTYVSFQTLRDGLALKDVRTDGTAEQTLLTGSYFGPMLTALSPDWKKLAWVVEGQLRVKTIATNQIRTIASGVDSFVWSPDSSRVAALSNGTLAIVDLTGTLGPPLAQNASDPSWSPSGGRIAVVEEANGSYNVHVVRPTGEDLNLTAGDARSHGSPIWSRDGKLAFLTGDGGQLSIDVSDGYGTRRTVPIRSTIAGGPFAWLADGRLAVGSSSGTLAVDVSTGRTRRLLPFNATDLVSSPDGKLIAFSAGGECRDRMGIYLAKADGTNRRRITNDCRIVGTSGDDTLHGTDLADVLVGLGGNDRLFANDPGYVGDTLLGGPGSDVLIGGFRQDTLDGGPGDDVLDGGPSGDTIIGGKGRDHLNGQGGADVIRAVDGQRDVITCGPNSYGPAGRDTVYADRIDSVAADCELVHRR